MERELIEKYKKIHEELVLRRNEMIAKTERLELLKQNPIVKEYLELEKECENRDIIDVDIDRRIYDCICNYLTETNAETNDVYVCFGKSYSGYYNENGKLVICYPVPEQKKVSCAYYRNLENWRDGYIIKSDECEEFEKNHIVINGPIHEISAASIEEFEKMSQRFVFDILNYGNEEAVKKVLGK